MTALTPGAYLKLRREAAGLSVDDVAALISASNRWKRFNLELITAIEQVDYVPTTGFVDRLRTAFAFDRYVYRQLLCGVAPAPEICTSCGCTALDACDDEIHGACAWATPAHDLCTACLIADRAAGSAA